MYTQPLLPAVKSRSVVLKDTTVRQFDGGWNVVDNDLNLSTRFGVVLDNIARREDGSMGPRWGTLLFADLQVQLSLATTVHIVNTFYFQDSVLSVLSDGRIARTLGTGTSTIVWNSTIAGALPSSPAGWGATDFASAAIFNGKLIICNGTDKPLIVDFTNTPPVLYLADVATGANVNVPIARYVCAMNHYLCMAGDPLHPDRVHISNKNTSGTWYGDAIPNDGTYVDLGKIGVQGEQTITGINRYREQLVVGFMSASVLGKLGIYNTATPPVHTPNFDDVVESYGCHSHRSMVNLGNDMFVLDNQGVTSLARSIYSGATEPKRVSDLVAPAINRNVTRLLKADTILGTHAVYNTNDSQYMCFVPNQSEVYVALRTDPFEVLQGDPHSLWVRITNHPFEVGDTFQVKNVTTWNTVDVTKLNNVDHIVQAVISPDIVMITPAGGITTDPEQVITGGGATVQYKPRWTETYGYIYTFIDELKVKAWARYRGWRWRASCRSELGNVFFASERQLYLYGNANTPVYTDFSTKDVTTGVIAGTPITFVWEWPWADFDKRLYDKHTRYMQLDTTGNAQFSVMMFVDGLYDILGELVPNNIMDFVAGGIGGFGNAPQPYGGGRRTLDQRLIAWVARGKLFKMRFEGQVTSPLSIVAMSLLYQDGSIRR